MSPRVATVVRYVHYTFATCLTQGCVHRSRSIFDLICTRSLAFSHSFVASEHSNRAGMSRALTSTILLT